MNIYRSWIKTYVVIVVLNILLSLATGMNILYIVINHIFLILFIAIESERFYSFLKKTDSIYTPIRSWDGRDYGEYRTF